jgi:hypothetical protein
MKVISADKSVLMDVATLSAVDGKLQVIGKIMGAIPMKARLDPADLRSFLWKLGPRTLVRIAWMVLTARK